MNTLSDYSSSCICGEDYKKGDTNENVTYFSYSY